MVIPKSMDDSNYVCELLSPKPITCVLIFSIIEYQDIRSFDTINIIDCNKRDETHRSRGLEELQTSAQVLSICETFSVIEWSLGYDALCTQYYLKVVLLLIIRIWNLFQKIVCVTSLLSIV